MRATDVAPRRRQGMVWSEFSEWRRRTTTLSSMVYYLVPPITLILRYE